MALNFRKRGEVLDTGTLVEPSRTCTIGDCIAAYKARPGGLHPFDVQRLDDLDASMGSTSLSETREARLRGRGHGPAPSTVARWRSTLLAVLTWSRGGRGRRAGAAGHP